MEGQVRGRDVFLAVLAYIPLLFVAPLLFRRKERFLLYHTRQGIYFFCLFLGLIVIFVGLFYVFHNVVRVEPAEVTFAVLVALTFIAYAVLLMILIYTTLRRKMIMLPILGDLAGER